MCFAKKSPSVQGKQYAILSRKHCNNSAALTKKCTVVGLIASANTKLIDYDNSQVFIAIVANSVDLFNIDEMGGKVSGFQIQER